MISYWRWNRGGYYYETEQHVMVTLALEDVQLLLYLAHSWAFSFIFKSQELE